MQVLQGNFSLLKTDPIMENQGQSKYRAVEPSPKRYFYKNTLAPNGWEHCGRGERKVIRTRGSGSSGN